MYVAEQQGLAEQAEYILRMGEQPVELSGRGAESVVDRAQERRWQCSWCSSMA